MKSDQVIIGYCAGQPTNGLEFSSKGLVAAYDFRPLRFKAT